MKYSHFYIQNISEIKKKLNKINLIRQAEATVTK